MGHEVARSLVGGAEVRAERARQLVFHGSRARGQRARASGASASVLPS